MQEIEKGGLIEMQMKTGVEQAVYAVLLLGMLPDKAVLPGEAISARIGASPTYFQKLLRRLVSADLIASTAGVKGGFRLKRQPQDITVYDIYLAVEGQQSLYSSCGILHDVLDRPEPTSGCLLSELMLEAEQSWKSVLQRETIASLYAHMCSETEVDGLDAWVKQKLVL